MITPADHDLAGGSLLLEVALQTKVGAALRQHLVVDCAMRVMACGATFAHCFMLEHKRPALIDMAFGARVLV